MELTIIDKNLNKIKNLDALDSIIWTDRYDKYGDFEIWTKADVSLIPYLQEDYYLSIAESEHIMVIETINLLTDVEDGDKFIVKGRSLESILDRRIIWNQTVLDGNLELEVRRMLRENAIIPADTDRTIPNLIFGLSSDPAINTLSITTQFSGTNLYDAIQEICSAYNIGFKITISSSGKFVFSLYAGKDRTYDQLDNPFVAFSPKLDNISSTSYYHSKIPLKTITLVAGEGEGSDRLSTIAILPGGAGTGLDRRELFTDAGDVSTFVGGVVIPLEEYYTQLQNRGLLDLLKNTYVSSFDGTIDPNVNYIYGEDFFLGDIIQLANEYGLNASARITEFIFSEDLSGRKSYPTFYTI